MDTIEERLDEGPTYRPTLSQRLLCLVGIHDYSVPYVMKTALVFSGQKSDEGWDTEIDDDPDPNEYVEQHCLRRGCSKAKKRPDIDPKDIKDTDPNNRT